jgi:3-isopropylmalate/(R)-2-methylmalate dehydratase large subunit
MTTPQSLAQKLIARAAGRPGARRRDRQLPVDLAMFHDSSGPRRLKPMLEELGATIWDKSKVVLVMDHYVPERDDERGASCASRATGRASRSCRMCTTARASATWCCRSTAISGPACSASAATRIRPPAARSAPTCSASAAPRCSAWWSPARSGCACRRRSRMHWSGRLAAGVCAKDMMLSMIARFGMNGADYQAVEFTGDAVRAHCRCRSA